MDGFPNGRRLEDDVTRIELQAVSGVVLAAIGLWYDDFTPGSSPVTPDLVNVLTYNTGVNANDTSFKTSFPYVQTPWSGISACCGLAVNNTTANKSDIVEQQSYSQPQSKLNMSAPDLFLESSPNPFVDNNTIRYHVETPAIITIAVFDVRGQLIKVLVNQKQDAGFYSVQWNSGNAAKGTYFVQASKNGNVSQTLSLIKQ
jgi:hypothetical protein